jgi:aminoglycoside phosphotransferase (APT) family kinase protein
MQPSEVDAFEIAAAVLGEDPSSVRRFPTGLQHFVYDVELTSGRRAVVRIAEPENRPHFEGALHWDAQLRPLGIPLPDILHADLTMERFTFPYLVLERLPGTDLGEVYDELSVPQRADLAREMVELQRRTAELPEAPGFGYALDSTGWGLAKQWRRVLGGSLRMTRRWIEGVGVVDPAWADRVEAKLATAGELDDVRPRAFLHDITTKNVIVDQGRLSGIVDVDSMAFGDPLWTVALTRMALLSMKSPTDYIDAWVDAMDPGTAPAERLDLYTALHCVAFLGEIGQAFNRDAPQDVDEEYRDHLEHVLTGLLS